MLVQFAPMPRWLARLSWLPALLLGALGGIAGGILEAYFDSEGRFFTPHWWAFLLAAGGAVGQVNLAQLIASVPAKNSGNF